VRIDLRPCTLTTAKPWIESKHSHHGKVKIRYLWAIAAYVNGDLVGVVVVGRPIAPEFEGRGILEAVRSCTDGYPNAASRLLGAAWGAAKSMGCRRMVSYIRADEEGTSYRAAGWVAVALVKGRPHNTGNRRGRYLPGMEPETTEIVDRVRWEIGSDAAKTRVRRTESGWSAAAR